MQPEKPSLKVLLVEDTALVAEQVSYLMAEVHYQVDLIVVETESDALAAASQIAPDMMILDLKLKEGNGFSVLRTLSASEAKPAVVVFTNYALPNYRELALLNGADYFLDKARDFEILPSIIDAIGLKRDTLSVRH